MPLCVDAIRPMPEDFAPTFVDCGETVEWRDRATDPKGKAISLGLAFVKTGDAAADERLWKALRASAWHSLELVRLGETKSLEVV